MATPLCKNEFNAQMQSMQSRVDNLETNLKQQMMVTVQNVISTWMALVAGGVTAQAAAKYLADPFIALLILGYVDEDAYDNIMAMLNTVPGFNYMEELFTTLVLAGIGLPPYGAGIISTIEGNLAVVLAEANQALFDALAADPLIQEAVNEALAAIAEVEQAQAQAAGLFTALNNVSACKVASNVFQAAVL